jgi:hypothetical protein
VNDNINTPKLAWHMAAGTVAGVSAGAAGYVNTDVSAITGTNTNRIWVIACQATASAYSGARAHGETLDNRSVINLTNTCFSKVDSNGHMDLYRNAAADVNYRFVGFFE